MASDRRWEADMPAAYDRILGPVFFAPYAEILAERAAGTGASRILEVAAGTGIVTSRLVDRLPDAEIVGTDLNPGMVGYAEQRVDGAVWRQADAGSLPFEAERFDLVVCSFGAMFFPDRVATYEEIGRVLGEDGRFLFSTWDELDRNPTALAITEILRSMFPDDPPDFLARIPHGYADPGEVRRDLEAAGFEVLGIERVESMAKTPSVAELTNGFCEGTPIRFGLEERGDRDELAATVAARMVDRFGRGPVQVQLSAWIAEAKAD